MNKIFIVPISIVLAMGFSWQLPAVPVVINFSNANEQSTILITKEQEKKIRKHAKEKGLTAITREEAELRVKKEMAAILSEAFKTPTDEMEKWQEEAKIKMGSLPESSRWIDYTLYFNNATVIDSVHINIYSFPFNKTGQKKFALALVNSSGAETISFLNATLDSCIARKYLD